MHWFFKVIQLCYMFDGLLSLKDELVDKKSMEVTQEKEDSSLMAKEEFLEAMYIQACYWSFGASIVDDARLKFDEYIKKISGLILIQDTPAKLATISKFNQNYETKISKYNKLIINFRSFFMHAFFIIIIIVLNLENKYVCLYARIYTSIISNYVRLCIGCQEKSLDGVEMVGTDISP